MLKSQLNSTLSTIIYWFTPISRNFWLQFRLIY